MLRAISIQRRRLTPQCVLGNMTVKWVPTNVMSFHLNEFTFVSGDQDVSRDHCDIFNLLGADNYQQLTGGV